VNALMADVEAAIGIQQLTGEPWQDWFAPDEINAVSSYWHRLSKDTPGKAWFDCEPVHPAVKRALRIDPSDPSSTYACAPFRLARVEGVAVILAAWPAPRILGPVDQDWFGIEQVIVWNPVRNSATILHDPQAQIVGPLTSDANALFADPYAFLRAWAEARAAFFARWKAIRSDWNTRPLEYDLAPGALMVGPLGEIRWPMSAMPPVLECVGVNPDAVFKAILKAARLPRVVNNSNLRAAA